MVPRVPYAVLDQKGGRQHHRVGQHLHAAGVDADVAGVDRLAAQQGCLQQVPAQRPASAAFQTSLPIRQVTALTPVSPPLRRSSITCSVSSAWKP